MRVVLQKGKNRNTCHGIFILVKCNELSIKIAQLPISKREPSRRNDAFLFDLLLVSCAFGKGEILTAVKVFVRHL